jgi:hypothetical protein
MKLDLLSSASRLAFGTALAIVVPVVVSGQAHATFLNGSVSLSDGGIALPTSLPATSIVSGLTIFGQGTPIPTSSAGNLAGATSPTTSDPLNVVLGTGLYSVTLGSDVFTFDVFSVTDLVRNSLSVTGVGTLGDSVTAEISGSVTDTGPGGYAPTAFGGTWGATGSCAGTSASVGCTSALSASWSAALTATGVNPPPAPPPPSVPEPASMALLGVGLVGLGATRRRRRS